MLYRIRFGIYIDGLRYEYEFANDLNENAYALTKKTPYKEKVLDEERYRIIHYETIYNRICVTPCPFKDKESNVFVGSANCESCKHFRGRNRKEHKIACNH